MRKQQPKETDLTILLDRSGSMESIAAPTIDGINALIHDQKLDPSPCAVTLVKFDSVDPARVVFEGCAVAQVRPIGVHELRPRGGTPLYDAIGLAVSQTKRRVAGKEADTICLFAIVTDGQENDSKRLSAADVKELIQDRESAGWRFIFLGANQDAVLEASRIGIAAGRSLSYGTGEDEIRSAHLANVSLVRDMRRGTRDGFTDDERQTSKRS